MNPLVEKFIASKLNELTLEQVKAYVAGDGSLVNYLLSPQIVGPYRSLLFLFNPEDFKTEWAKEWFRQNRPDLWQIFSMPEGGKWLDKTCFEIRVNLRRLQKL